MSGTHQQHETKQKDAQRQAPKASLFGCTAEQCKRSRIMQKGPSGSSRASSGSDTGLLQAAFAAPESERPSGSECVSVMRMLSAVHRGLFTGSPLPVKA